MFWNTIPCSVANYFTTKIYQKCHFSAISNLLMRHLRHLSHNSRSFDGIWCIESFLIHQNSFQLVSYWRCFYFEWHDDDMFWELCACSSLCYSNFLSDGEIFRMKNMQDSSKFLLVFINESTSSLIIFSNT